MSDQETGTVKWYNGVKGYGFLQRDAGGDVFVHSSAIRVNGFNSLKEGQRVQFTLGESEKGVQALQVVIL
jgi:CspA family cold shock protein